MPQYDSLPIFGDAGEVAKFGEIVAPASITCGDLVHLGISHHGGLQSLVTSAEE
jgi:hypothetical protein